MWLIHIETEIRKPQCILKTNEQNLGSLYAKYMHKANSSILLTSIISQWFMIIIAKNKLRRVKNNNVGHIK